MTYRKVNLGYNCTIEKSSKNFRSAHSNPDLLLRSTQKSWRKLMLSWTRIRKRWVIGVPTGWGKQVKRRQEQESKPRTTNYKSAPLNPSFSLKSTRRELAQIHSMQTLRSMLTRWQLKLTELRKSMSISPWRITCLTTNLWTTYRSFMKNTNQRRHQNLWQEKLNKTRRPNMSKTFSKEVKNGKRESSRRKKHSEKRSNATKRNSSHSTPRSISSVLVYTKKRWEWWKFCIKVANFSSFKPNKVFS